MKVVQLPANEQGLCTCQRKASLRLIIDAQEFLLCWECAAALCWKLNDLVGVFRYAPFRRSSGDGREGSGWFRIG